MADRQKIGLMTAIAVCLNAMIGSGIFTAPTAIASSVGPVGIVAFLFVGIAVWCLALSFARLAQVYPESGSFYTYTNAWAGHEMALVASAAYVIGLIVCMSMVTHVCSFYLSSLFPAVDIRVLGSGVVLLLTVLNLFGVSISGIGQQILLVFTLFPLFAIIAVCIGNIQPVENINFEYHTFSDIFQVTRIVIFGFFGFECAASLFGVVDNPQKNVPLAVSYSVLIIATVYTLFVGSLLFAIPIQFLADATVPLSTTLSLVLPHHRWLVWCIHISILSAMLGTLHSMIWSASNFLYSCVHRIVFIKKFFQKIEGNTIYYQSLVILIGGSIVSFFLCFNNLDFFFSLSSLLIVLAYCLSVIGLFFIKHEWQSLRNVITLLGVATAGIIMYFSAQGIIDAIRYI